MYLQYLSTGLLRLVFNYSLSVCCSLHGFVVSIYNGFLRVCYVLFLTDLFRSAVLCGFVVSIYNSSVWDCCVRLQFSACKMFVMFFMLILGEEYRRLFFSSLRLTTLPFYQNLKLRKSHRVEEKYCWMGLNQRTNHQNHHHRIINQATLHK